MAYVNTTRAASNGLMDRFASFVDAMKVSAQRRRLFEQTVRELSALSDRDLADMGISRRSIGEIAQSAAYGA